MTEYTIDEIQQLLSEGYMTIPKMLWDYIPNGSHIRYVLRDDGQQKSRNERFRRGGFTKNHFYDDKDAPNFLLETRPGGSMAETGYLSYPLAYHDIEELWKKYDRGAFVEIHLMAISLAQKKKQIETLTTELAELNSRLTWMENTLKAVIR
jgi:hypothetical protein